MRWQPDVARGAWVAERVDWSAAPAASMHSVVPRGFPAHARVFHPLEGLRPVGTTWEDLRGSDGAEPTGWESRSVTWRSLAGELGVTWHPLVQWGSIARASGEDGSWNGYPGPGWWRYDAPATGGMPPQMLAAIARLLARRTSTPASGQVAVWDGHGGLFSNRGFARITFTADRPRVADASTMPVVADEPPLGSEVEYGPRLELPARSHVLFDAGIDELADASWPARAPWVRDPDFAHEVPSLIWPEDRAWVLASEVDFDSTVVAGSAELVAELRATPGLEVEEIPEGADLSAVGDRVNG